MCLYYICEKIALENGRVMPLFNTSFKSLDFYCKWKPLKKGKWEKLLHDQISLHFFCTHVGVWCVSIRYESTEFFIYVQIIHSHYGLYTLSCTSLFNSISIPAKILCLESFLGCFLRKLIDFLGVSCIFNTIFTIFSRFLCHFEGNLAKNANLHAYKKGNHTPFNSLTQK